MIRKNGLAVTAAATSHAAAAGISNVSAGQRLELLAPKANKLGGLKTGTAGKAAQHALKLDRATARCEIVRHVYIIVHVA